MCHDRDLETYSVGERGARQYEQKQLKDVSDGPDSQYIHRYRECRLVSLLKVEEEVVETEDDVDECVADFPQDLTTIEVLGSLYSYAQLRVQVYQDLELVAW